MPSTAGSGCAAGKLYGDCDDLNALVNPGRTEVCNDGVDNDCDGKRDSSDPDCKVCNSGGRACTDVWSCFVGSETCDAGCCDACPPAVDPVKCGPGECLFPGGSDVNGCPTAQVCRACASSCGDYNPVCGTDYANYQNECLAAAAGVQVLHQSYCWNGEGVSCAGPAGSNGACGPSGSYYCRAGTPMRCTGLGFCQTAADCPAGRAEGSCADAGTPRNCLQHQCSCDPS